MEIKRATLNDARALAKLKLEIWRTTYKGIYPEEKFTNYNFKSRTEIFEKDIRDRIVYVAQEGDQLIGFTAFGDIQHPYKDFKYELAQLYILKNHQGKGLGRRFIELCKKYFEDMGVDSILINCNKYNTKAQGFYKKIGAELLEIDGKRETKDLEQCHYILNIKGKE